MSSTRNCGKYISISDGASEPGASWKTISTPSMARFPSVLSIVAVGAISVSVPRASALAEAGVDMAARRPAAAAGRTVLRAPAHGVAGHDVLATAMLHEAGGRQHLDLAGRHIGLADHALDAAEMVGVAVRYRSPCRPASSADAGNRARARRAPSRRVSSVSTTISPCRPRRSSCWRCRSRAPDRRARSP